MSVQQRLKEALHSEVEFAQQLLAVLHQERAALSGHDAAAMESVVADKQQVADQLEKQSHARDHLLHAGGHGPGPQGLQSFIASAEPHMQRELSSLWQDLAQLLKQCREENQINGGVIEGSQRSIREALAILRGDPQTNETYGKAGKAINEPSSHCIAKV